MSCLIALHSRLDRIKEMMRDCDIKATDAYRELEKLSQTVLPGLEEVQKDAIRSEALFREVAQWSATIPAQSEFTKQVLGWSLHMSDASERIGYEISAIQTTIQKMRTYTTEKNAMLMYLSESIKDVRCLHNRLQARPITESTETQTDPPEPLSDVSVIRKLIKRFLFLRLVLIIFVTVVVCSV